MSNSDREFSAPNALRLPQDVLQRVEAYREAKCEGGEAPNMSQALRALIVLGLDSFEAKQKRSKR